MIDGYAKAAPDSMVCSTYSLQHGVESIFSPLFSLQKLDDFAFNFIAGTGDFIDIPKMLFPPEKPEMAPQDYIDAVSIS